MSTIQGITEEQSTYSAQQYWDALKVIESVLNEKQAGIVRGKVLAAVIHTRKRDIEFLQRILDTQKGIRSAKHFGQEVKRTKKPKQPKTRLSKLEKALKDIEDLNI